MKRGLHMRASCAAMALIGLLAVPAMADVPGVSTLIQQGRYWQSKGRQDLANQAFRRALQLDPNSADAKRALSGPPPRAQARPTPAPASTPVAAPTPEPHRGGGCGIRPGSHLRCSPPQHWQHGWRQCPRSRFQGIGRQ